MPIIDAPAVKVTFALCLVPYASMPLGNMGSVVLRSLVAWKRVFRLRFLEDEISAILPFRPVGAVVQYLCGSGFRPTSAPYGLRCPGDAHPRNGPAASLQSLYDRSAPL